MGAGGSKVAVEVDAIAIADSYIHKLAGPEESGRATEGTADPNDYLAIASVGRG